MLRRLALLLILLFPGCGGQDPDTTPPAAIEDFRVHLREDSLIVLVWTAPGDDGMEGRADRYEVRLFSGTPTWPDGTAWPETPVPAPAGEPDTLRIEGQRVARYYAIRSVDDAGNWSAVSDFVSGDADDLIAPEAVDDLAVEVLSHDTVKLSWSSPFDDGPTGGPTEYEVRRAEAPITDETWEAAVPVSIVLVKRTGEDKEYLVRALPGGRELFFAIRSFDGSRNRSDLSNVVSAVLPEDVYPPATVTPRVRERQFDRLRITWTSPGDDENQGNAEAYEIRIAPDPLGPGDLESTLPISGVPAPRPPGLPEEYIFTGLDPQEDYWIWIRARDESGNLGGFIPPVQALHDSIPPVAPGNLGFSDLGVRSLDIEWTSPGDDGSLGSSRGFEIRIAESPLDESNWDEEESIRLIPDDLEVGFSPGSIHHHRFLPLPSGTRQYIGVRAVDDAGNRSAVAALEGETRPASVLRIYPNGSGDASSIQAAIDIADEWATIEVYPGTYYENLEFLGKSITLRSVEGPAVTVIDGSLRDSAVVTIRRGETRACRVEGFTIRGGRGSRIGSTLRLGGGIFVIGASPEIIGNVIVDNHVTGWGGGLVYGKEVHGPMVDARIEGNRFEGNTAAINGGGMMCGSARAEIIDNDFVDNEAAFDGGGIFLFQFDPGSFLLRGNRFLRNLAWDHGGAIECGQQGAADPLLIEYNLFVGNEAYGTDGASDNGTGGGISIRGWDGTIRNNTFVANLGDGGDGCTGGGILISAGDRPVLVENNLFYAQGGCGIGCRGGIGPLLPTIRGNMFWDDSPKPVGGSPECLVDFEPRNLFQDPLFCDPENGDYTLRPDSPALLADPPIGAFTRPGCTAP